MSYSVIQAENLGKSYKLVRQIQPGKGYKTLQEDLRSALRWPLARLRGEANHKKETFWALKDVSFEVKQGEVLGIIGRNGAGKSTLLKLLARITEPSAGQARLVGRVGSLLEVGTGFHPELTGRENIYLNGAILGMSRQEIRRKFDEIVDFAEVEQFLDTPVKRYSSGMYVRLAFAVAAHLEPEILIVDEVLAVGDSRFQEKCLGKMSSVAHEGRTILFVSHSMAAVQQLCSTGIVLDRGRVVFNGPVEQAIAKYTERNTGLVQGIDLADRPDRKGSQALRFTSVSLHDEQDRPIERVLSGQDLRLRFYYDSDKAYDKALVNLAFNIYSPQGVLLTNLNTKDVAQSYLPIGRKGYFECQWPRFNLRSGVYTCTLFCELNGSIVDWIQSAFQLHVEDGDFFNTGSLVERVQGDVLVAYDWYSRIG